MRGVGRWGVVRRRSFRGALLRGLSQVLFRSPHHHLPGGGRGPGGKVAVTTRCPSLPPSPNWAPAFAGEVPVLRGGRQLLSQRGTSCRSHACTTPADFYLSGGSRGPIGEVVVTTGCPSLPLSPNWAPAFAGVVVVWGGLGWSQRTWNCLPAKAGRQSGLPPSRENGGCGRWGGHGRHHLALSPRRAGGVTWAIIRSIFRA